MITPMVPAMRAQDRRTGAARPKVAELEIRLAEAEAAIRAIRSGEIDAIMVTTPDGEQVYSLKGAEQPYREMIEAMSEGALNVTPDGMVLYCNKCLADMVKADLDSIMGTSLLTRFAKPDGTRIAKALREAPGETTRVRAQLLTMDGVPVPVNVAMHVQADAGFRSVVIVISDLTQVVAAQEATAKINNELERANRALHLLNVSDTTIMRATDEMQLLAITCQTLVDVGGYKRAWIGYAQHDEAKSVRPVAQAGGASDYLEAAHISWADVDRGRGPAGTAIRTGLATVTLDADTDPSFRPWRELARRDGIRSSGTIPLRSGDEVFGVLTVYSGRPHTFDDQESALLIEFADDISYCVTNLRREQKLADTRALLDNILQSSTKYSIIGEDLDRRIVSWNEGARRNYGYEANEVIGKQPHFLYTPEDLCSGAVERLFAAATENGVAEMEFQRLRKDGTQFPDNVVVTRRDDPAGRPIGYLVMSSDVSEKRQAEAKLRSASEYARSLIEASLDTMAIIGPDGKITDVNHAAELITGRRREHLIGTDFTIYFTEPEKARAGYRRVFTKGFLIDYPLVIRHVAGTVTETLCNASLYHDASGAVGGVCLAARDMSRVPTAEVASTPKRRWNFSRYVIYAVAAIVAYVAACETSFAVYGWLQRQQNQAYINRITMTNSRIQSLLSEVAPAPARVRAAKVQYQPGSDAPLSYTSAYAVASPNHTPGVTGKEAPISRFAEEMPYLLTGRCAVMTKQITDQIPDLADFIACPISDLSSRLIGILTMSWDRTDPVPTDFGAAIAATQRAATDIAGFWLSNR